MTTQDFKTKKMLVIASPSGGGKSTIARHILQRFPRFQFSISATTRQKRPLETDGKEYFFLSKEDFLAKIESGGLVEYEEIFGNYYGTLHSEIEKVLKSTRAMLFDVDVKGALSLKKAYPQETLLVFIAPPSVDELEERLRRRSTETDAEIRRRLARAEMEIAQADKFDVVIINENLYKAKKEVENLIRRYF